MIVPIAISATPTMTLRNLPRPPRSGMPPSTTTTNAFRVQVASSAGEVEFADLPSPMADLPVGATFGSLVHAVLEHADHVAVALLAVVAQRVAAHQPVGQVQVDVGAGRELGQFTAARAAKFDAVDVFGLVAKRVDVGFQKIRHDRDSARGGGWGVLVQV